MTEETRTKAPQRLGGPIEIVTLLNIEGIMKQLLTLEENRQPIGAIEPQKEPLTVTSEQRLLRPSQGPWFEVSIVNDGPNDCQVLVNSSKSLEWHTVRKDETYRVSMSSPIIKDVLFRCAKGETADLRVVGTR